MDAPTFAASLTDDQRLAALARAVQDGRISREELQTFNRSARAVADAVLYGHALVGAVQSNRTMQ